MAKKDRVFQWPCGTRFVVRTTPSKTRISYRVLPNLPDDEGSRWFTVLIRRAIEFVDSSKDIVQYRSEHSRDEDIILHFDCLSGGKEATTRRELREERRVVRSVLKYLGIPYSV